MIFLVAVENFDILITSSFIENEVFLGSDKDKNSKIKIWNFWNFDFFEKIENFRFSKSIFSKKSFVKSYGKIMKIEILKICRKFWLKIENFTFFIFFIKMCQNVEKYFFQKNDVSLTFLILIFFSRGFFCSHPGVS